MDYDKIQTGGRMFRLRNPCKKCIVDVVCSQVCEEYCQYDDLRETLIYRFNRVSDVCLWCFRCLMWFSITAVVSLIFTLIGWGISL